LSQLDYSTSADFVLIQLRIKVFIMYTDSVKSELIKQIKEKAVVHGKVILSSGKEADYYVDLRRVTLDSVAAPLVGQAMLEVTKDLDFECVGGLTLGADPVATAMMHVAKQNGRNLNAFVVRKEGKAHGLQRRIEGPDVKGKKVLAVEDTSTTGGSVLTAVEALKEAGAIVVGVAVVVDRGAGKKIEEAGLKYLSVVTLQELGLS
jgi:orotate phosphoribosyltransferase